MATVRPFAYNTGSTISGTEQIGDLAIGVDDIDYDGDVGGVKWWNGPDEDLGYVIAKPVPNGTQPNPINIPAYVGFNRSVLLTESSFVDLTNNLFNQSFTTGIQCKTYLNNNGFWTSYVSNLKLHLDAADSNSYSGVGTTWYDLSGNGNDVNMVNSGSITWNNTGAVYFSTGSNGWFNNPSGSNLPIGNSPYTYIIWVQLGNVWSANGFMSIGPFGAVNQSNAFRAGSTNQLINYWWGNDLSVSTSVSPTNEWFNAVVKYDGTTRSIFVNGVLVGSDTPVGHNVTTSTLQIAKTTSTEYLQGNIGEALIYDVALSDSDILQYYNDTYPRYISPTPTPTPTPTLTPTTTPTPTPTSANNLLVYLDSGNVSSYPTTGDTWFDLEGAQNNATLINTPTYSPSYSGILQFDDVSLEYATIPNIGNLTNWTIEVWFRLTTSLTGKISSIVSNEFNGSVLNFSIGTNNQPFNANLAVGFFDGAWRNTTGFVAQTNTWYQVVGTYDGSTIRQYVNGVASGGTLNYVGTPQSGGEVRLMRRWDSPLTSGNLIDGDLAIVKIYNTALNSTQILDSYNNTYTRFIDPTPTPTQTVTPTPTITPTITPTVTPSITPTNTPTPSITPTITPTKTVTPTPTITPSSTPNSQGFDYPNFASTTGLVGVGNTSVTSNIYYLTTAANNQVGNVYRTTAIQYNRNFSAQWSTFIGGGTGADGYCIQWTPTNNTNGTGGGGVGLLSTAINAITFLTYTNNNYTWYKNNVSQGATSVTAGTWRQTLYFWGDYNHSAQTFALYWNTTNSKPGSANKTFTSFVFDTGSYYMGFGAATGGANDNHQLLSWKLTFT